MCSLFGFSSGVIWSLPTRPVPVSGVSGLVVSKEYRKRTRVREDVLLFTGLGRLIRLVDQNLVGSHSFVVTSSYGGKSPSPLPTCDSYSFQGGRRRTHQSFG